MKGEEGSRYSFHGKAKVGFGNEEVKGGSKADVAWRDWWQWGLER